MPGSPTLFHRLFSLEGRAALITGASGGIGRALAVALAEAGAIVGLHGTNRSRLEETQQHVEEAGGQAVALPAELSDVDACRRLIAEAHAQLGRLDILVNCAGMNRRQPIAEVQPETFDTIVAVNLRSAYFLSQAAHPIMRAQGGGKILNIGSMNSHVGLGHLSVYGITKSALMQLTKTMAVEWARDNIQVNCLAPGFIMTPLTAGPLWGDPHKKAWLLARIPARRPGTPEDLVGAALLLVSDASAYITGHTLNVDGGFLAGGTWDADA
ncbi:MAG TPA: glucose 1-dehydrogenase [Chthonomonadaceae bacterium]|nr:glucose 1-dehydrogenase [Chthonomonadaceae bacterium]